MTDEAKALVDKLRDEDSYYRIQEKHWCIDAEELERQRLAAADLIETKAREIERLREANGILEDGLQEVGDDYPGSSCQEWCQHQIKQARAALGESHD